MIDFTIIHNYVLYLHVLSYTSVLHTTTDYINYYIAILLQSTKKKVQIVS